MWSLKISSRLVLRIWRMRGVWVRTTISGSQAREQLMGGWSSPSTSTTHMRQAPKPGSLGS